MPNRKRPAEARGGSWKVAYADFVTAMMALFIVLWITSQDKKIQLDAALYFKRPLWFVGADQPAAGMLDGSRNPFRPPRDAESPGTGSGHAAASNPIALAYVNSVAEQFRRLLQVKSDPDAKPIEIQVLSDKIQVTLFDRSQLPLFAGATSGFTPWGRFVLQDLSWLIERYGSRIAIEGYTRDGLKFSDPAYGPFELSLDRANATRRLIEKYAVHPPRIDRVAGYGATDPLTPGAPDAAGNERVVITIVPLPAAEAMSVAAQPAARPAPAG